MRLHQYLYESLLTKFLQFNESSCDIVLVQSKELQYNGLSDKLITLTELNRNRNIT